ncbi:MAG: hypothetical protein HYX92_03365 [Chloroflexi bacterium]|nr:hypothetical protein [Chloroflexota bacterium]
MTIRQDTGVRVLEVLDPVAAIAAKTVRPAPRLRDLSGRKIGLYSNTKPGADVGLEEVARMLQTRFQGLKFEKFSYIYPHGNDIIDKMAQSGCEGIVSATAD